LVAKIHSFQFPKSQNLNWSRKTRETSRVN
jgi:hypothetical protein